MATAPLPPVQPLAEVPVGGGQLLKVQIVPSADKPTPVPAPKPKPHPQAKMAEFWKNFEPEYLGKITRILPDPLTKTGDVEKSSIDRQQSWMAARSYNEASAECLRACKRIVKECQEQNVRFTDPHFDIEDDLKIQSRRDCLEGLVPESLSIVPGDVKRVGEIFKNPQFFRSDTSPDDVVQGTNGDCWFLSALSALKSNHELVKRICVFQNQVIGVYGFVFHRDGDWHQAIVDDKLYLRAPAYDEHGIDVLGSWSVQQKQPEDEYERLFQTGSQALQFAQCSSSDETWVPLLEKAYAKAHGDYAAINAGQTGEGLEDLTGGVTTEIYSTNILDKDTFWNQELNKVGRKYLFSCGLACFRNWRHNTDDKSERAMIERAIQEKRQSGLVGSHAYAVLATYQGFGKRLVKIRNPWGHTEWRGAWSDGSREWTEGDGEWPQRLKHKFADDGIFWMAYEDFLKKLKYIDKTRLLSDRWHVSSQWASIQVPWSAQGYHDTKFSIQVPQNTPAVIVLSQLDDRYFTGLEGKYDFRLQFRVQKDGNDPDDYVARSRLNYELIRSVNVEVELEGGATYTVLIKVEADKTDRKDVETVIRNNVHRREKIRQIAMSYDLAHQKGMPPDGSATKSTPVGQSTANDTSKDDNKDLDRDPWNAMCVVGLRVYSRRPDLSVSVLWSGPNVVPEDETESRPILDGEDPAKAAFDQATAAVGKDEADEPTVEDQAQAKDENGVEATVQQQDDQKYDGSEEDWIVTSKETAPQATSVEKKDRGRPKHRDDKQDDRSDNLFHLPSSSPPVLTPSSASADADTDTDIHEPRSPSAEKPEDQIGVAVAAIADKVPKDMAEPPPAVDHSQS